MKLDILTKLIKNNILDGNLISDMDYNML